MPTEPIFGLEEYAANQAQAHLLGNEKHLAGNAFAALRIEARQNSDAGGAVDGDTYIVGDVPAGLWVAFTTDSVAIFSNGGWIEVLARAGMGGERRDLDGAWTYYSAEESAWVVGGEYWSTTEQRMRGRFPGDVDRFVIAVEFSGLANIGTAQVAHGITNPTLDEYLVLEGTAFNGTQAIALPWTDGTDVLQLRMTTTNIEIVSDFNATAWNARVRAIYSKD
ncbi:MAG: hypothetical protein DRH08_00085 [Deltaproteobacteria bacterium]|nr:MAG: hypothetical protein DRH08_00085 [Deltaproteobacteria bacterium]